MKIKLEYVHPYNYGNLMMVTNFINYFCKLYDGNVDFYINVKNNDEFRRVKMTFEDKLLRKKIYKDDIDTISSKNKLDKIYNFFYKNRKRVQYYDTIIYLGGDCISEYYSKKGFIKDGFKIFSESKKIPVFLVAQTIGPFTSYRQKLAYLFLKNTFISTRDEMCYYYLKNKIKLKLLLNSRDLAFLDLPYKHNEMKIKEDLFSKYGIDENEYITIVLSGLYRSYTPNKLDYVDKCFEMIKGLFNNRIIKNKKIILLPHVVLDKQNSDINIINEIEKLASEKKMTKIIFIKDILMPHEARIILGYGLFTITGRMHAAVSTFQMKKPAISLSYSVKYNGVIGKGLNMNDLVIESTGEDFWKRNDLENIIEEKVEYLLDNYNDIVNDIAVNVNQCKTLALKQIEEIVDKLKK